MVNAPQPTGCDFGGVTSRTIIGGGSELALPSGNQATVPPAFLLLAHRASAHCSSDRAEKQSHGVPRTDGEGPANELLPSNDRSGTARTSLSQPCVPERWSCVGFAVMTENI